MAALIVILIVILFMTLLVAFLKLRQAVAAEQSGNFKPRRSACRLQRVDGSGLWVWGFGVLRFRV